MLSRGKKLLNLAISGKSTTITDVNVKTNVLTNTVKMKGNLGKSDLEEPNNVDVEDPWIDYYKWHESRSLKPRREIPGQVQNEVLNSTQNFEISLQTSTNDIPENVQRGEDKGSSVIENSDISDFEDSSVSWKPDEKMDIESSQSIPSETSEIINNISPICLKDSQLENCDDNFEKSLQTSDCNVLKNVQTRDEASVVENSANFHIVNSPVSRRLDEGKAKANSEGNGTQRPLFKNPVECSLRKGHVWDKKDRCPYCNKDVTNFSRHIYRKHSNEESVKRIIEQPKGDRKRKFMIDLLRKQGNFTIIDENIYRPVQRPTSTQNLDTGVLPTDFLPCKYCKGLYKKKSLRRHVLRCYFNQESNAKQNFASEGQTMMVFTESRKKFLNSLRLKNEVLSSMHADRISFNGKNDPIICQYAEDYLRRHKRPHMKSAVSNKVRELGRLLIPLQDHYEINSMLELLKPEHFDKAVSASRIISGYNEATRSFRAPSLALHMRTILLAVCSSAKTLLLKKNPVIAISDYEGALKNLKGFRELVDANWKFEMGSLALKDLNEKQSANPQKLPVTQDIILFRNYTHKIAETCMKSLSENPEDLQSFKKLTEAALALTIILNRKRIGDVQYTKLESYYRNTTSTNQEECLNSLEESERELAKHFKRIVTVGKGSRTVPILFSKHVQECMETLLSVRKRTTFVPQENPFLFALTGSSSKWVDGSAVLRKYAVNCGAKNPATLTSSRLRKQIATVLQILNLNDTEMEQVAAFMGHTKKTHEEFYRLPQEVFQTAKIAKLLLMMEKGVGSENKGKTLDEIDVELESWNIQTANESGNESDGHVSEEPIQGSFTNNAQIPENENQDFNNSDSEEEKPRKKKETGTRNKIETQKKTGAKNKPETKIKTVTKKNSRGSWNEKQKSIMLKFFKSHIKNKISPKKSECLKVRNDNIKFFEDKNWVQIKVFVYNTYKKNK